MNNLRYLTVVFMMTLSPVVIDSTAQSVQSNDTSYWERIKKYFDKEDKPAEDENQEDDKELTTDTIEWLKKDIKNIGAWEYRILEIDLSDLTALEAKLNELGAEKWDCFWINEHNEKVIIVCKKPRLSYLKSLPVKNLLKIISVTGDDQE